MDKREEREGEGGEEGTSPEMAQWKSKVFIHFSFVRLPACLDSMLDAQILSRSRRLEDEENGRWSKKMGIAMEGKIRHKRSSIPVFPLSERVVWFSRSAQAVAVFNVLKITSTG